MKPNKIFKTLMIALPILFIADLIAFYSIDVLNTLLLLITVCTGLTIAMFYALYALKVLWDELSIRKVI